MEAIGFEASVLSDLVSSQLRSARATLTVRAKGGEELRSMEGVLEVTEGQWNIKPNITQSVVSYSIVIP